LTAPDRRVVQCNYISATVVAPAQARAYVCQINPGWGCDRIVVLVRSYSGRWVKKWENRARLFNFRVKTLPPRHPLYGDDRILNAENATILLDLVAREGVTCDQ
jgi:hypothetical protein